MSFNQSTKKLSINDDDDLCLDLDDQNENINQYKANTKKIDQNDDMQVYVPSRMQTFVGENLQSSGSTNPIGSQKIDFRNLADSELNFDDDLCFRESITIGQPKAIDLKLDDDLVFESSAGKKQYDYALDDLKQEESNISKSNYICLDELEMHECKTKSMLGTEFDLKIDDSGQKKTGLENDGNFDPDLSLYDDKLFCKIFVF